MPWPQTIPADLRRDLDTLESLRGPPLERERARSSHILVRSVAKRSDTQAPIFGTFIEQSGATRHSPVLSLYSVCRSERL